MTPSGAARTTWRQWVRPALRATAALLVVAMWLLFTGSFSRDELMVGATASVAAMAFLLYVCEHDVLQLTLRTKDLIQLWRIPWYLLSGAYEITVVFLKDLAGLAPAKSLYRVCGFDTSTRDPIRVARTILAVAYTTTAPNFIVIDVDPSQSRMLFHQLEASSVPAMTKALGAKS